MSTVCWCILGCFAIHVELYTQCVYICMYVSVCMYICVYIYHVCTYIYVCVYERSSVCMVLRTLLYLLLLQVTTGTGECITAEHVISSLPSQSTYMYCISTQMYAVCGIQHAMCVRMYDIHDITYFVDSTYTPLYLLVSSAYYSRCIIHCVHNFSCLQ